MSDILMISNNIKDWLTSVRRDLHLTPELGLEEFITRDKIIKYLNEIGIKYKTYENHTGVMAYIYSENAKYTVGLRADIDALPIQEESNVPYRSIFDGKMHACGHDAHTAILLGACKLLHNMTDLNVNIKFFFQPAEETVGGAKLMIADDCMKNPAVDYMFGLHVMPDIDTGFVELKYDTLNASTDTVIIDICGKSGHGAYPHQGIDAIVVASHVITMLQSITSRNTSPTNSIVLSLGTIVGGVKENVICDKVEIKGTLRTLDATSREFTKKRIIDIVKNTCNGFLATGEVSFIEGYAPLVNNNNIVDYVYENTKELIGEDRIILRKHPSLGAEDFSFFLEHSEGAFYHLGCRNENLGITSLLHTNSFNVDEDCIPIGVALHVLNVININKIRG